MDRILRQVFERYALNREKRKLEGAPFCSRCKTNHAVYVPVLHAKAAEDPPGGLGTADPVCYRCALASLAGVAVKPPSWTHGVAEEPRPDHGTRARYNEGCRCADCRDAAAAYMRHYRARRNGRKGKTA